MAAEDAEHPGTAERGLQRPGRAWQGNFPPHGPRKLPYFAKMGGHLQLGEPTWRNAFPSF